MCRLVILALLVPTVFGRTTQNFNRYGTLDALSIEDQKEIQKLSVLTKQLADSGEKFNNSLQLTVTEDDVSFFVYNRKNPQGQQVPIPDASNITTVSSFDTNLQTIFAIHGWHNNFNSTFNFIVGQAYLEVRDVNIVSVNWDELANGIYLTAYNAVPYVGDYVGQFIRNVSEAYDYSLDNISLVGHSLGAHIAGFAGQETNGDLHSITGLDPAGPLYFESSPDNRLSEGDAQYVQAIHTDASLLGVNYNLGHADFWPNGGKSQPGCSMDITGTCSHGRAYNYFMESLTSGDFIAKQCSNYADYTAEKCKRNPPFVMGGPYVNTTVYGTYYLETNSTAPYALGDIGL